jgi:hypothetical protein
VSAPVLDRVPVPSAVWAHLLVYLRRYPKELMLRNHVWTWGRSLCIGRLSDQDTSHQASESLWFVSSLVRTQGPVVRSFA